MLRVAVEEYIKQRIGKTLGERWRLDSVLGVGGMAAVYAAKDPSGQEVAVKVLHPEIGMRPEIRDRFMREGYVANKIQHPGVVRVLEHGAVDEWSVFLVMERLVGESLADRVTPEHPVALVAQWGHVTLLNTRGLRAAGIAEDAPDPLGGWRGGPGWSSHSKLALSLERPVKTTPSSWSSATPSTA